jgi:predicted PhzF superfamily epimerase YddE/YHI9
MSAREFAYHLCDVFTSTPLEGNQLAVFPDANGNYPFR